MPPRQGHRRSSPLETRSETFTSRRGTGTSGLLKRRYVVHNAISGKSTLSRWRATTTPSDYSTLRSRARSSRPRPPPYRRALTPFARHDLPNRVAHVFQVSRTSKEPQAGRWRRTARDSARGPQVLRNTTARAQRRPTANLQVTGLRGHIDAGDSHAAPVPGLQSNGHGRRVPRLPSRPNRNAFRSRYGFQTRLSASANITIWSRVKMVTTV